MTDIQTRIDHLALALKVQDGLKYSPDAIEESYLQRAKQMTEELTEMGIQALTYLDEEFPEALIDVSDCPKILYVKSTTPLSELFKGKMVTIAGTRDQSMYGRDCCMHIVRTLADSPIRPTIVSGLALGIDFTAHTAALEAGMKTIAVLPCGLDEVYPKAHTRVAERIASTPGCALISPFPPGTAPTAYNFLSRNLVIAALSETTIIVETKQKGGAKIIAHKAYELDRKVWAVPGRIDDIRSAGCNELIGEGIADILTENNFDEL